MNTHVKYRLPTVKLHFNGFTLADPYPAIIIAVLKGRGIQCWECEGEFHVDWQHEQALRQTMCSVVNGLINSYDSEKEASHESCE